ncbi:MULTISPECIES: hypothetical protein [unclassified Kitasatospora]|uniref:hypothetical protein n=1 Tax=unclassified Kitasatospora TaxID=2633591 RepID=UPI00070C4BF2|nr:MULTISPECIES: hypothetical protein [unclassified Kitasatospora]KQV04748.1 hypothetical protein ASC99_15370 [Kitasatospora sp. Root107]KRB60727.1 hypothetical protein ASE03_10140 [Kitasatospora sp. Root187]
MTPRRRWPALLVLAALLALGAYAWGVVEHYSGGRALVADALYRPAITFFPAIALLVVTVAARTTRGRTVAGLLAATTLLYAIGAVLVAGTAPVSPVTSRQPNPAVPDRVLVVTHHGNLGSESESQSWTITVETGTGWSLRRWQVDDFREGFPGHGSFESAAWSGPDRITVRKDNGTWTHTLPLP